MSKRNKKSTKRKSTDSIGASASAEASITETLLADATQESAEGEIAGADVRTTDDSSSSSSSEDEVNAGSSGSWRIDLGNFSKTKTKLETAINSSSRNSDLMSAYFDAQHTALTKLPWDEGRAEYGIFPLHKFFFTACANDDPLAIVAIVPNLKVKHTKIGNAFMKELQNKNTEYFENNTYQWGDVRGTCIGTYFQMLRFPKQAFKAFRRYVDSMKKHVKCTSRRKLKRLLKACKRWLKSNHSIWNTVLSHMDVSATHVCSGLEMSNGILLLSKLFTQFGHTHAQCLAALLRELTNIKMRKKDPDTNKPETIQKYFDRVDRIAHDASNYPTMKVPIATPLLKVFALEGLLRSSDKYESMVTMAYSNNLSDTFAQLIDKMQTVEGMRSKTIRDEYGSTGTTNLASATVQTAKTGKHGDGRRKQKIPFIHDPEGKCELPNHYHKNKHCSVQRLRHLKAQGNAKPVLYDRDGKRICEFKANSLMCPFEKRGCNQSHKLKGATRDRPVNVARTREDSDDSASSESDARSTRSRRKNKKKRGSHKQKKRGQRSQRSHRHKLLEVLLASSSGHGSDSSSDFM